MSGRTEREVKIRFTGESAVLKGTTGEVRKVFQMLSSDLNDARGAGEKLAAAYKQVADSMERDMRDIADAADVVRDSLGPEMTQAIEASGRTVEDQVQEWRKLGLTLDDVKRDSDLLADGLKQLDASARQSTGSVGDGLKKVADGSERAKSNMANFAGNAASELPLVSGALGPLNVGIGQMVEGFAEGAVNVKDLVKAGGTMVGITAILAYINNQLALMKAKDAFRTDQVEGFEEVLKESSNAVADLTEHLRELGEVQITTMANAGNPFADATKDVTAALLEAGLTAEQYAELIAGGEPKIRAWVEAQKAAGNAIDVDVLRALGQGADDWAKAADKGATNAAFFGKEMAAVAEETDRGADSLNQHMDATARDTLAQESLTTALERAESAQRDLTSAQLASIDSGYAVADAQDRFTESMEALAVATDDPKTGVNELDQAQRSAEQAALAMATATAANAEALAVAAGAPLSAAESNYLLIDSLYKTALGMDENSPVRKALLDHIGALQGVPSEAKSTIVVDNEDASTRMGFVRQKSKDAESAVGDLSAAVSAVPGDIPITATLIGYTTTMSQLSNLMTRLDEVKRKADAADRAVGNVAG